MRSGARWVGALVACGVWMGGGAAWAHPPCPEHGEVCPPDAWKEDLGTLSDRTFLLFDWGLGGMSMHDQFDEVFQASSLGMVMRLGGGVDNFAFSFMLGLQTPETPVYAPLTLLSVGVEARWYVPLTEELDGLRVWVSGSGGLSMLSGCEESGDCEPSGDPAIASYSGQMVGAGAGVAYLLEGGFLGVFAEARRERHWLESVSLQRTIEGDLNVFMVGLINEFSWKD